MLLLLSPSADATEPRAVREARATMLPDDPVEFRRRAAARSRALRVLYVVAILAIAGLVSWGTAEPVPAPASSAAALGR